MFRLSRPLQEARTYASLAHGLLRFTSGLKAFLREPMSLEAAEALVRRGTQIRDYALVSKVERAVFAYESSPYLKLFRAAGCELGDFKALVRQEGVEAALEKLRRSGIYVTYEEFKGRSAAVRGSQAFIFRDAAFDNPLATPSFYSSTGGSSGRPTRILIDLDHMIQSAPHWALWFAAHGVLSSPLIFLTPMYPGIVNRQLICAKFGNRFVKWFTTGGGGTFTYRLVTAYVHNRARRVAGFPGPVSATLSEAWKVGLCLAEMLEAGMRPCVNTAPSDAIRVCLAMQERGKSLRGVTFLLGAEPLTPARRQTIEASGAKAVATYGFSEGGTVGSQCPSPVAADDIHISADAYAVIQHSQRHGHSETPDALLVTALRPACPKVLLNTEIGDYAVLETRRCSCLFEELGHHQHLHTIRSFRKLTGEGVTFKGADIFRLLEEVLPRRYGGTVADYQLVEVQDARGLPRYQLLVSPEVGPVDERALIATFLDELRKLGRAHGFMANRWAQADVLRVVRRQPASAGRGKLLPFRTLGSD